MARKPTSPPVSARSSDPALPAKPASSVARPELRPRRVTRGRVLTVVAFLALVSGAIWAYARYRVERVARTVRQLFVARRYDEARQPLSRWLALTPSSGEAIYYQAWAALVFDRPGEAADAIHRARVLGFEPELLHALAAIGQARSNQVSEAEPFLEQAFRDDLEPRDLIAKELARIYLATYRLDQAAPAIARYRELAPDDPQPYLWSNEIASRTDSDHSILIQNYRAALERDPSLDKARLGLAEELSADRRFDEAKQEFQDYLKRHAGATAALVGLGRNAFQQGNLQEAKRQFEAALAVNPREPDALKEAGQIELRLGRFKQACGYLQRLVEIDPFDHTVRYSLAQAIRLSGDPKRAEVESAAAERLRKEHDQIMQLRYDLRRHPQNLDARFQIARWLLDHGHEDEGLKWTSEVLRADPNHAPTHNLLAGYYAKKPGSAGLANYHRTMASAGHDGQAASTVGAPAQNR